MPGWSYTSTGLLPISGIVGIWAAILSTIWSYETGCIVGSVCISPDSNFVAAGSHDSMVYFFNSSGNLLWSHEIDEVRSVSISADGSYIAAGSSDHNVGLFSSPSTPPQTTRSTTPTTARTTTTAGTTPTTTVTLPTTTTTASVTTIIPSTKTPATTTATATSAPPATTTMTAILWLESHLIEIIATTAAVVTPVSAWLLSRRRRSRLRAWMKKMESTYRESRFDESKCKAALLLIREQKQRDLEEGHITAGQFALIDRRLDH